MRPGAVRVRAPRLVAREAARVVAVVRAADGSLRHGATACEAPLSVLVQLLRAAALPESEAGVWAPLLRRSYGVLHVRSTLAWRFWQVVRASSIGIGTSSLDAAAVDVSQLDARALYETWREIGRSVVRGEPAAQIWLARVVARASSSRSTTTRGPRPQRSPAVGRLACRFPDTPFAVPSLPARIDVHTPPYLPVSPGALARCLAGGGSAEAPVDAQQQWQLERVASWQLHRYTATRSAVFTLRTAYEAASAWAQTAVAPTGPLPRAVAMEFLCFHTTPTMTVSSGGQYWSASTGAPLEWSQYWSLWSMPNGVAPLLAARRVVSASKLRGLWGQSVHGASALLVADYLSSSAAGVELSSLCTVGAIGSGINTLLAALAPRLAPALSYRWYVDACDDASVAHDAFWAVLGQRPTRWRWAEDHAADATCPAVDLELITLRCSPYSPANRSFPAGCWAALAELVAVMRGVASRRPRVIIYENTQGLWRDAAWRRRVESVLSSCSSYRWVAISTSPHLHSASPVRRPRVFYVGVRH